MRRIWLGWALTCAAPVTAAHAQPPADPSEARQQIAGAENWALIRQLPGIPGRACAIRAEGPEANTTIVLNNDRKPLLVVGRGDWSGLQGEAEASLSIDGQAPVTVSAGMAHNLVLVLVTDEALLQSLRGARTLDWTFPFGRFRAGVAGLGVALDALLRCRPDPS